MINIGNPLESDSKLMFYPTEFKETLKMLPLVGQLNIDYMKEKYQLKNDLGDELYQKLFIKATDKNILLEYILYNYFVETNQLDKIKEYFTIHYGFSDEDSPITICDYFAGEGKWLDVFKSIIPYDKTKNHLYLIANELEKNRYNIISQNPNIDECTNLPFEDTQYPKNHASLVLFNPPYGTTNGERNTKYYLKLLLRRELFYHNHINTNFRGGKIICVLRGDDILDCNELLNTYFCINWSLVYKVNEEEYEKYKQYVLVADLMREPLNDKNKYEARMLQENVEKLREIIEVKQPEFNISLYDSCHNTLNSVPYKKLKDNFKYVNQSKKYLSKNDNVLKWIKDLTMLKENNQQKLILPKEPKIGELSLIISSGYINGNLNLDGKVNHVVIGGVKPMTKQETKQLTDDKGEKYTETKTIKYTEPYLNLLINNNGKLQIKELGSDEN